MNRDQVCLIPKGHEGPRVCVISFFNDKYAPLAEIARPNWEAYCKRHGYALRLYPGEYHEDPERVATYGDKGKFQLYYDVRGHADIVMFLDIDSLIVNADVRIEDVLGDRAFLWTYDDSGPLSGLWIARTDDVTEKNLRFAYERAGRENNVRRGQIEPHGISDQDSMRSLMCVPPFSQTFAYCYPAVDVGHCYPENYVEGKWIVTFPGRPVEEKLALMRQWGLPPSDSEPTPEQTAQHHPVEAYNPKFAFDRNWVGPADMKPRVYRTQSEKDTWYAVAVENEYHLPANLEPTDTIVDIGAHIGSFSYLAYRNGSRSVYAYEIDPWHVEAAAVNLADYQDGIALHHSAVVRGDERRAAEYHYDGAWNSFGLLGPTVPSKSLDQIIDDVCSPGEPVRFLKIDCEGGEWPILATCRQIDRIMEIAGEYHIVDPSAPELSGLPITISVDGLVAFLEAKGFAVQIVPHGGNGNFFAKRVAGPKWRFPAHASTTPLSAPNPGGVFVARLG